MKCRQEIEKLAYELYEKNGRIPGHEMDHWIEAERIICSRHAVEEEKVVTSQKSVAAKQITPKKAGKTNGKPLKTSGAAPKTAVPGKTASAGRSKKTKPDKSASM